MSDARIQLIDLLKTKSPEYEFIPMDISKNGNLKLSAICIRSSQAAAPVICTEAVLSQCGYDISKAADMIYSLIRQQVSPDIDIDKLSDKDFILEHIYIAVQRQSDEPLVKHPVCDFPGMEAYLYISDIDINNSRWTVRINPGLLSYAGISEELAWQKAKEHTFASANIRSFKDMMTELRNKHSDYEQTENLFFDHDSPDFSSPNMYIISNSSGFRGAASILDRELLRQFALSHDCHYVCVLPSSIHECILLPLYEECDSSMFDEMVREVNASCVSPEEMLVDQSYILSF